jgi:hypothetical protein
MIALGAVNEDSGAFLRREGKGEAIFGGES